MGSFEYGMLVEQVAVTATAAGTTTLVNTSKQNQVFTGSTTQTIVLPNATTMSVGQNFNIFNQSSGAVALNFNGGSGFTDASGTSYSSITAHTSLEITLQTNGTSAGTWAVVASAGGFTNPMTTVVASYYASASQTTSGAQQVNFDTKIIDTNNAVTTTTAGTAGTWKFTAPVSGNYQVIVSITTNSGTPNVLLYKNGSLLFTIGQTNSADIFTSPITIPLNANDFIDIRVNGVSVFGGTQTYTSISIVLLQGFPGTISARYYSSTSTITSSLATITYATLDYDTNSAYSGGAYTVPTGGAGKYQINARFESNATISIAAAVNIAIAKNGTVISQGNITPLAGNSGNNLDVDVSDIINLAAGDTIAIQASNSGTSPAITASNVRNYFSICRVGN